KKHQEYRPQDVRRHLCRKESRLRHAMGACENGVVIPSVVKARNVFDHDRWSRTGYLRSALLVAVEQPNINVALKRLSCTIHDLENDLACGYHGGKSTRISDAAHPNSFGLRSLIVGDHQRAFDGMQIFRIVVAGIPRGICSGRFQVDSARSLYAIPETEMVHQPDGFDGKDRHCRRVANLDQVVSVLLFGTKGKIAGSAIHHRVLALE